MIWRDASKPLSLGMLMSIRMTSGLSRTACSTASAPSRAVPATSRPVPSPSSQARYSRVVAESSARSTRITASSAPAAAARSAVALSHQPPDDLEQLRLVEARLDHVGVGAHLHPPLPVLPGVDGRHQHQRQVGDGAIRAPPRRLPEALPPG